MATILSENFDAVTAPALPTGWNATSGIQTETTLFNSSPNGLTMTTSNTEGVAYYNTSTDGNGGDAQASINILTGTAPVGGCLARVFCRLTTASTVLLSNVGYCAVLDFANNTVAISKVSGGTFNNLATTTFTVSYTEVYRLFCRCVGHTITARLQRASDSKWLDSSGAWQTAVQEAATSLDLSVNGAGKAGVGAFRQTTSVDFVYVDDFLFESIVSGTTARRRVSTSWI